MHDEDGAHLKPKNSPDDGTNAQHIVPKGNVSPKLICHGNTSTHKAQLDYPLHFTMIISNDRVNTSSTHLYLLTSKNNI